MPKVIGRGDLQSNSFQFCKHFCAMHVPHAPDCRRIKHRACLRERELEKGKFKLNKMKQVLYKTKYNFVKVIQCYRIEE